MPRYRLTADGSLVPHDLARHLRPEQRWRSTHRWHQLRAQVIEEEPACRECGSTADACCDHVIPVSRGGAVYDRGNCQRLCQRCNAVKGNRVNGGDY
jgi:5-methylcytosine-specific restriction endonuclease McrA